jgi:hypothetical protein
MLSLRGGVVTKPKHQFYVFFFPPSHRGYKDIDSKDMCLFMFGNMLVL